MIRWLVIGEGQAGCCHITAIQRTENAELAGVIDPLPPPILDVAIYTDVASVIADADIDAVVIASPNNTQAAVAAQSIEAGLPVLCEKPAGQSVDDAKTMVTLSQQQNVPVGMVLNQRAQRHSRWIKSQIETGTLKPRSISFTGRPARLTDWHADPDGAGGGVLRTIGMHYLDLYTWWSGARGPA